MSRQAQAAHAGPPRRFLLDQEIYELTGSWWPLVEHLAAASWRLPLLLDVTDADDAAVLRERLYDEDDPLTLWDVEPIAERLVEAATGHPWWVAGRLLLWADQRWEEIDGELTLRGVHLARLIDAQPGRACNAIYAFLVRSADPKDRARFDTALRQPPPEAAVPDPFTEQRFAEDEGAAFLAAMGVAQRAGAIRPR